MVEIKEVDNIHVEPSLTGKKEQNPADKVKGALQDELADSDNEGIDASNTTS